MYFENDSTCPRSNSKSQGCPVPVGNTICGETNSLEIMKQFNRLYEERMEQVDSEAEWIRNLCQQNEMLVRAVQELEFEATERVHQLEDKLQKSAQCLCDVMKKYREHDFAADLLAEPLQKITHLEDDVRNLLEFIKRIRENQDWSLDGLFFYNISERELLGTTCKFANKFSKDDSLEGEKLLNEKDRTVHELTQKLDYFNSFGDVEAIAKELQARREECDSLKQEMAEIRQALTEEVATKYDEIVLLRKDVQIFEERCMQADKQTAFKEDIIRELRKEIKQLKQQVSIPEKPLKPSASPSHKHSQTSPSHLEVPNDSTKPYIIVNHSSKKQPGKNTVIYINKDGSVRKEDRSLALKDHSEACSKCKSKLSNNGRSFFPNCKSETDLVNVKSKLRPVQARSKLTNFGRCKTFVDQTKRILNEIEFEELFYKGKVQPGPIPVKMHVTEKFLSLVAEQLTAYFRTHSASSFFGTSPTNKADQAAELGRFVQVKEDLLKEQLRLITLLVTKLYHVDQGLEVLEKRALSVTKLKRYTMVTEREIRQFQQSLNQVKSLLENTLDQ
ncbi:hypothetical protein HUJ04_002421 [Dendroctonus ponderosae]|nr:hypothetical protein HUJ04_002421 [Dendroctonus ponderosae]